MRLATALAPATVWLLVLVLVSDGPPVSGAADCFDIDGDGIVQGIDAVMVSDYLGQKVPPAPSQVDTTKDGIIHPLGQPLHTAIAFRTETTCQSDPLPKTTLAATTMAIDARGESTASDDEIEGGRPAVVGVPFHVTVHVDDPPPYVGYQLLMHWDEAILNFDPRTYPENDLFRDSFWKTFQLSQTLGPPDDDVGNEASVALGAFFYDPEDSTTLGGPIAQFRFTCQATGTAMISLDTATNNTAVFARPAIEFLPEVTSAEIECLDPYDDYDGDGCNNSQESGMDAMAGGRREFENPWDFYDTNGDKVIDLFIDIFGVASLFGADADTDPPGEPDGYDPVYDRSAPADGMDVWDMGPPDGTIDLFIDIFGVAYQFGHDCT